MRNGIVFRRKSNAVKESFVSSNIPITSAHTHTVSDAVKDSPERLVLFDMLSF